MILSFANVVQLPFAATEPLPARHAASLASAEIAKQTSRETIKMLLSFGNTARLEETFTATVHSNSLLGGKFQLSVLLLHLDRLTFPEPALEDVYTERIEQLALNDPL